MYWFWSRPSGFARAPDGYVRRPAECLRPLSADRSWPPLGHHSLEREKHAGGRARVQPGTVPPERRKTTVSNSFLFGGHGDMTGIVEERCKCVDVRARSASVVRFCV